MKDAQARLQRPIQDRSRSFSLTASPLTSRAGRPGNHFRNEETEGKGLRDLSKVTWDRADSAAWPPVQVYRNALLPREDYYIFHLLTMELEIGTENAGKSVEMLASAYLASCSTRCLRIWSRLWLKGSLPFKAGFASPSKV